MRMINMNPQKKMDRPTIVFASMCKNEQHCIKNTLESVYKFIDYWVICDTGSTDKTCQIIQDFFKEKNIPGELFVDGWVSFGDNKSLMMKRAQGKADYIMHLDADDLLIGDFKFTNEDAGKDSYLIPVKRGNSEWKALILFNGKYLWKFSGVAHTTIRCLDNPHTTQSDLSHYGYYISGEGIGSRAFDSKKYFYDAEKLQKQFFDTLYTDPDGLNIRSVFYTAQSYMDCGMINEGLQWNKLYTKLKNTWIEEEFEAQMRISRCLMQLQASEFEIEEEMIKAIQIFPDRAEPYFNLGLYFNQIGNFKKGYTYLKEAKSKNIDIVKQKYILFINERCYNKFVNDELSVACYWTDRKEEGIKLITKIIDDKDFSDIKERLLKNLEHFNNKD
jgi:glycosyltransferase involved in cell wall biosynthesis